jgi:drug/metabolite transporter (DMT)-like permease
MMVALTGYVIFAVTVRLLSRHLSFAEICALRAIGASFVCLLVAARTRSVLLEIRYIQIAPHLLRSSLHVLGTLAIVLGLVFVPFGVTTALEFTGPIFATLIVFLVYRAAPSAISFVGLVIIFGGASLMILSQYEASGLVLLLPVAGTLILTCTNMMLRPLVRRNSFLAVLLLMNLIQVPIYCLVSLFFPHKPLDLAWSGLDVLAAIGLSVSGLMTQLALAKATRFGSDLQISALDTLRIPAVAFVAYLVFAETLGPITISEIGLIIIGAIIVAAGRLNRTRQLQAAQGLSEIAS